MVTRGNQSFQRIALWLGAATCLALAACQTAVTDLSQGQTGSLSYPGTVGITLLGDLELPANVVGKVPAVVLVHGAGGVGYRQHSWGVYLREQGLATMTIDYFGPRGHSPGSRSIPRPTVDIFDAMKILATHPQIDPERIGVIGWSNGGVMSIIAANIGASMGGGHTLKAHVAIYPVCQRASIASGGSGAPILILIGSNDSFTKPKYCQRLMDEGLESGRDVKMIVYEGAYHGWDGDYTGTFSDRHYGKVTFWQSQETTERSRRDVMNFLNWALNVDSQ